MIGRRISTGFAAPLGPHSYGSAPPPTIDFDQQTRDRDAASALQASQLETQRLGEEQDRQRAFQQQDRDRAAQRERENSNALNAGYGFVPEPTISNTSARGGGGAAGRSSTISVPSLPPPVRSTPPPLMEKATEQVRSLVAENSRPVVYGAPEDPGLQTANDRAYAGAKDRIGRERLNAVRSFQSSMDGRGLTGSTGRNFESGGVGSIIGSGLDELGDVALDQAQDAVGRNRQVYDREVEAQERRRQMALGGLIDLYRQMGLM